MSNSDNTTRVPVASWSATVADAMEKNGNHALQFLGDLIRGTYTSPESVANPAPRHEAEPITYQRLAKDYPQWADHPEQSNQLRQAHIERVKMLREMRANSLGKSRQRSR